MALRRGATRCAARYVICHAKTLSMASRRYRWLLPASRATAVDAHMRYGAVMNDGDGAGA